MTLAALFAACLLCWVPTAHSRSYMLNLLKATSACQPWTVPQQQQCSYLHSHAEVCNSEDGLFNYLELHYCAVGGRLYLSTPVFAVWVAVLFGVLIATAEHFFCPALELISDYLSLSPSVAGATLLAFGNAAPDIFTQLAGMSQGEKQTISMALTEPLGGGLFVSNVVFALVIWLSNKHHKLDLTPHRFLKDVLFYTLALAVVFLILLDNIVHFWEALILGSVYVVYLAVTLYASKDEEPIHADPALHEVPVSERLGSDFSDAVGDALRIPLLADFDESPAPCAVVPSEQSQAQYLSSDDVVGNSSIVNPVTTATTEPTTFSPNSAHSDGLVGPANLATTGVSPMHQQLGARQNGRSMIVGSMTLGESPGAFVSLPESTTLEPSTILVEVRPDELLVVPLATGKLSGCLPSDKPDNLLAFGSPPTSVAMQLDVLDGEMSGPLPVMQPALGYSPVGSVLRLDRPAAGLPTAHHHRWSCLNLLTEPLLLLLCVAMPRVSTQGLPYHRAFASVLPLTGPLLLVLISSGVPAWLGVKALVYGSVCALPVCITIFALYPKDGIPQGTLKGLFTVLAFGLSLWWMSQAAQELVAVCAALGQILGLPASLLGATVLAWGNSLSDMVADSSLARDGYPSLAVTACFASPLFSLSIGLCIALSAASFRQPLHLDVDRDLMAMYLFALLNMFKYLLVVPFVFHFSLGRRAALTSFAFYLIFQCLYLLTLFKVI